VAGRHRRAAALPSGAYARPASLDDTGLLVTVYGESGGVEGTFDFTPMPGSLELRRAFAAAFDRRSGPGGTWRTRASCGGGYNYIRDFLRWAAARNDPPRSPAEITPALWAAWRLAAPTGPGARQRLATVRMLLPGVPGIPADTLRVVERRLPPAPPSQETGYSYQEYTQIRATAAAAFTTALVRIRSNREHLRRWHSGEFAEGSADWLVGDALDHVVRTGDVPLEKASADGGGRVVRKRYRRVLGGNAPEQTWGRLYLTRAELFAAAVLLVAGEAWNRSVVDRMRVPDHDPAAGDDADIHTVEVNKRRRPVRLRYTTNNLLDSGPDSPGRLMSRVVEATETARQTLELQGRPTDRLLVGRCAHPASAGEPFVLGVPALYAARAGGDDGGIPLVRVSLRRLRRTVQVLIRKEPAQNSPDTHASVYMLRGAASRRETTDTIARGLSDALDHARVTVKMRVLLGGEADRLVELADDPELAGAVARGDLDTATAACTDFTHSPFTAPGLPCTASFLLCLACPNAVATRRHLPRLAYLRDALDELRAVVDAAVWDQDWREHFLRVSSLLDTHTTPAQRAAARAEAGEADRRLIDRLLRRGLDT
jgi:hypothetical protein